MHFLDGWYYIGIDSKRILSNVHLATLILCNDILYHLRNSSTTQVGTRNMFTFDKDRSNGDGLR